MLKHLKSIYKFSIIYLGFKYSKLKKYINLDYIGDYIN